MKYQIQQITLETGNAIHLPHAMYMEGSSADDACNQLAENFEVLGAKLTEAEVAYKTETVQQWKRPQKEAGLFDGKEDLKAQRKPHPAAPKVPVEPTPAHPDDWEEKVKAPRVKRSSTVRAMIEHQPNEPENGDE